ncbi:heavy-metal-associated domain-containing protein [Lysobacter soli]|uniref:heavy-metal-associated domain-containing protein n=1 Tax=Lysobacter soli TaxID=453783 RepID=UPI003CECD7FA
MTLWAGTVLATTPKIAVLDVENVTCPACSITIEKALDKVPGVSKAQVNTEAATVTVSFDAERTSVPALARAISDAGFPAKARPNGG